MENNIQTRFTEQFKLKYPVALAPMDKISGGHLAGAVAETGGLGLIGGGYGDAGWLEQAFQDAGNRSVGVGFVTWCLKENPRLLEKAIKLKPAAFMISFGRDDNDGTDIVAAVRAAGIPTIWQVQRLEQAKAAHRAGVDVIVVQGQEAGGHGMDRGLFSLVPAVRDFVGWDQTILAAGGIADGRGLAASLMLGADGVMMGTRFWASEEASGSDTAKQRLVASAGDQTVRSQVFDIARGLNWPDQYSGRVVRNTFLEKWHDDMDGLRTHATSQKAAYEASDPEDLSTRVLIAGEAIDLIESVEPAAEILQRITREAAELLRGEKTTYILKE